MCDVVAVISGTTETLTVAVFVQPFKSETATVNIVFALTVATVFCVVDETKIPDGVQL